MIQLNNILPLTDFKRNSSQVRSRLKRTGLPAVLTVEGRPELVVQDAAAYQKLLDLVDQAAALDAIREGLEDIETGRTKPLATFDREFRKRHGVGKKK